jgi:hypothetical protein
MQTAARKRKKAEEAVPGRYCELCKRNYSQLRQHVSAVHEGKKNFSCNECSRRFDHKGHLLRHQRSVHQKLRPYACNLCDKSFVTKQVLQRHRSALHEGLKPFACSQCDKSFSRNPDLQKHKSAVHEGLKPFACSQCDQTFSRNEHLQSHKSAVHEGLKPFACSQCHKTFTQKSHLRTHVRHVHDGERNYVCHECGHANSTLQHLNRHIDGVHKGLRPFQCEDCPSTFTRTSHLKAHLRRHEEQKSYTFLCPFNHGTTTLHEADCIACWTRCKTEQDLKYHICRNHTLEGLQAKHQSENKLAAFFDSEGVSYDRDWNNRVAFCDPNHPAGKSARPDFHLLDESARLGAVLCVCNDEWQHANYTCEARRMFAIAESLAHNPDFAHLPFVYVRFNPHPFKKNGVYCDLPLDRLHEQLLGAIRDLRSEDMEWGLNLVYLNYDTNAEGRLEIFACPESEDVLMLEECVRAIV